MTNLALKLATLFEWGRQIRHFVGMRTLKNREIYARWWRWWRFKMTLIFTFFLQVNDRVVRLFSPVLTFYRCHLTRKAIKKIHSSNDDENWTFELAFYSNHVWQENYWQPEENMNLLREIGSWMPNANVNVDGSTSRLRGVGDLLDWHDRKRTPNCIDRSDVFFHSSSLVICHRLCSPVFYFFLSLWL